MGKQNKNGFLIIAVCFIVLVVVGIAITKNVGKTDNQINAENAKMSLSKVLKKINVKEVEKIKGSVELGANTLEQELPDISKYPLSVEGKGDIDIEIFSSTEKSSSGTDGWLNVVAEKFNSEGYTLDGKTVSVSIRPMASGLSVDYIVSGKYIPEGYTPSNELFGEMIAAQKVPISVVKEKLVANQAGVILQKDKYNEFVKKYGEVSLDKLVDATVNDGLAMGYTNPYASATGLNFLISTLFRFDAENPLSDKAIDGFKKFQENVPFVSYTTLQMRDAVSTGALDSFILEYQTYVNDAELTRNYVFTPFGAVHNNPLYQVGNVDEDESAVLEKFSNYCLEKFAQGKADEYGFNKNLEYTSDISVDGATLLSAQKTWKEQKDSGKPIIAVFVADISGSMMGEPINELKKSLTNGSQYINKNNYIGLVSFNSDVYVNLPVDKFDLNQRAFFNGAVNSLSASGATATYDAMLVGLDMILKKKEEVPDSKAMLFLLSDGMQNRGNSLGVAKDILEDLEVPVYTIGYGDEAEKDVLADISSINEAASIVADSDDVVYKLKSLFNSSL